MKIDSKIILSSLPATSYIKLYKKTKTGAFAQVNARTNLWFFYCFSALRDKPIER